MRLKQCFTGLLLLFVQLSFGQKERYLEVLRAVLDSEQGKGATNLLIQCERPLTFFDMEAYQYEAEISLPLETLYTLSIGALKSKAGRWEFDSNTTKIGITKNPCISAKQIQKLFRKTGKRQNILSVSTPVFDASNQYCVIQVAYAKFTKSSYGLSCLLLQSPKGWEVIAEFDFWMS
ncbi:MAG: hypothetical protein RLZZ241_1123 [Bacteroidota bacterium]|jgi:hypothetical protein